MPSDIPFLGPCPTSGAVEFYIPITWSNWFTGSIPDAPVIYTSPLLRGGLWDIFWEYLDPSSFRIHRATGTDPWIAQNIYDGFDPSYGSSLITIDPDPGISPLDADVTTNGEVGLQSGLRIGTGIPQEGHECDCAIDLQGTGNFTFELQHRYTYTLVQWAALGVPETTSYLIHGLRTGN